MKLRTQFALLIAGIFAIPLIMTAILGFFYVSFTVSTGGINKIHAIGKWLQTYTPLRVKKTGKFTDTIPMTPPPEGLDVVFADQDGKIFYSTFPNILINDVYEFDKLIGIIRSGNMDSMLFIEPFRSPADDAFHIKILCIDRESSEMIFPGRHLEIIPVIFAVFLIGAAITGIIIMSRLGRAILRLESGTQQIVDGNLDFRLHAKGNDEIASLTRSFDVMREKLKEELEKRSRFLMAVSHDLATPLTSIEGYAEALLDGYADDETMRTKYLGIILDKSKILDARIAELIEFVRMETGEWKMTCVPVNIKEFVLQTIPLFDEDAVVFKRSFSSSVRLPGSLDVEMDKSLFMRALENLFHNAVRYSREEDSISFNASFDDSSAQKAVVLAIADSGAGIPGDELPHIFDPFFRGKTFSREKGFGLGLSTVRSIIEAHGWTITVTSTQGKGSVFTIRIPVGEDE